MTVKSCLYALGALAGLLMLPGCAIRQQAYYVSPFNGNNNEYLTLPTHRDTTHSALYASLSFSTGHANDFHTDHFWSAHTGIYAAHQVGLVQFYYGLNLDLGTYAMGQWAVDTAPPTYYGRANTDLPYAANLNTYSGSHFFGGAGFRGGFDCSLPLGGAEWRFMGVETSITREFGNYLAVRKEMADSIATLINRDPLFTTIGLTSELVIYGPQGEGGVRIAYGWALGNRYSNPGVFDNESGKFLHFTYFNCSFHCTYRRLTGFIQMNEATKAFGGVAGVNYRLWTGRTKPLRAIAGNRAP